MCDKCLILWAVCPGPWILVLKNKFTRCGILFLHVSLFGLIWSHSIFSGFLFFCFSYSLLFFLIFSFWVICGYSFLTSLLWLFIPLDYLKSSLWLSLILSILIIMFWHDSLWLHLRDVWLCKPENVKLSDSLKNVAIISLYFLKWVLFFFTGIFKLFSRLKISTDDFSYKSLKLSLLLENVSYLLLKDFL